MQLFIYTKMHLKTAEMENFENKDLSGDFKKGAVVYSDNVLLVLTE